MIDYEKVIRFELKRTNIRVLKWCDVEPDNHYEAYIASRCVRIPRPTDTFNFYVCLHEIGHVVTGERQYAYLQEYNAEKWAINRAEYYGVKDPEYLHDARIYVLKHCITDRLLFGANIRKYVLEWIGVDNEHFSQLVADNGYKMILEYARNHVDRDSHYALMQDTFIDRRTKYMLKLN